MPTLARPIGESVIPDPAIVTTLGAAHAGILASLEARFGARIARYGAYELDDELGDPQREIATPALLLRLESFVADLAEPDPWGRLPLRCAWSVRCLLSTETQDLQRTLPQLAAAVVSTVIPLASVDAGRRGADWGLGGAVGLPEAPSAQPDGLGIFGADSWVVRWEQVVYVSEELPL